MPSVKLESEIHAHVDCSRAKFDATACHDPVQAVDPTWYEAKFPYHVELVNVKLVNFVMISPKQAIEVTTAPEKNAKYNSHILVVSCHTQPICLPKAKTLRRNATLRMCSGMHPCVGARAQTENWHAMCHRANT